MVRYFTGQFMDFANRTTWIGFRQRTDEQHRQFGEAYAKCTTNKERDDFVKKNATRWSEFARLPYFDFCRMIVIDPMHNLILGGYLR